MSLPVVTGSCVAINNNLGGALDSLTGRQFSEYIFETANVNGSPDIRQFKVITDISGFCTVGATVYSHLEPQA